MAVGGFGVIYDVHNVATSIIVSGRRFARMVVKVPKEDGVAELKTEVESLGKLEHENVVQILGMAYCAVRCSPTPAQFRCV